MNKAEQYKQLLAECYPFLVHALCSIPDSEPEYKKASALVKKIDPIINAEIYEAFKKNKEKFG